MPDNRGVAYIEAGKVEVQSIDFPSFELKGPGVNPANVGRQLPHAAIVKCVTTNICGSDQHMVRGRTSAPEGLILSHEITGEVIEVGPGVEFIRSATLSRSPPTPPAAAPPKRRSARRSGPDPTQPGSSVHLFALPANVLKC